MIVVDCSAGETVIDVTTTMYPSRLHVVTSRRTFDSPTSTFFGVTLGSAELETPDLKSEGASGTFFSLPRYCAIDTKEPVVVIERIGFLGIPTIGRLEGQGRLSYIDGCTDSILVSPPRLGDPVLNLLHFPPGTIQSLHTHPSIRLGVVVAGRGTARGNRADKGGEWTQELSVGMAFLIESHENHAFQTDDESAMSVVAYHPDSDWGPSDEVHPMLNRTYIGR